MTDIKYTDIKKVSDAVAICRSLWSHAWDDNPNADAIDGDVARIAYRILCLRCIRCGRERYDYIDRNGGLIGRYYRNPVDYPRLTRYLGDELRVELIRRSLLVRRYTNSKR